MKLRIGIIRRESISNVDGVNRFIFTLADGLDAIGHKVFILSYSRYDSFSPNIHDLRAFFGLEGKQEIYSITDYAKSLQWPKMALSWMTVGSRFLADLDLDSVIINGITPVTLKKPRICVNHGIRTEDGESWTTLANQMRLQTGKYLYKHYSDQCVCVSKTLQKQFQKVIGLKSTVIPLPVKLHFFTNPPFDKRQNIVLHVGTRPGKNPELSIKIVNHLVDNMKLDAKLIIAGTKNLFIDKIAAKYSHLQDRVQFVFDANRNKMAELLKTSKALLLPSYYEGTPYSVIESFASGLPVVVSNAVPSDMVLDGQNGFRVKDFNPSCYAVRIAYLLSSPSTWNSYSEQALISARQYSYTTVARRYEETISQTAKNHLNATH